MLFFKRLADKKIKYPLFWVALSLLYALIFEVIEFLDCPVSGFEGFVVIVAQWAVVSFFASTIIGLLSLNRWIFAILFPVFTLLSAVMAYYTATMGIHLTGALLEVVFVNDMATWSSAMSGKLLVSMFFALISGVFVVAVRFKYTKNPSRGVVWLVLFVLVMLLPIHLIKRFRNPVTNRVPYVFYFAGKEYLNSRHYINNDQRDTFDNESVTCGQNPPYVVFVIGESLRPGNLQLNGYDRATTPLLAADTAVVSLPNVTSPYVFTHQSVPHILTRADIDRPDIRWEEQSFISLFKKAGYRTSWVSNQDRCAQYSYFMNEADTLILASSGKSLYSFNKWLDTSTIPHIHNLLNDNPEPQLIVVHSIGSHWWYPAHYSDSSAVFKPEVDSRVLSELTKEQMVNSYDNTVVETDRFLHGIIDCLKNRNAIMIYISDHGESLGENGNFLHKGDLPEVHPTACLVWYSDEYAKRYPRKVKALKENSINNHDTDVFFHSVPDAAGLNTNVLDVSKSIFHTNADNEFSNINSHQVTQ